MTQQDAAPYPHQWTNEEGRGGLRVNPGAVFSATFLILRTVCQTKDVFTSCSSRISPHSPGFLILPFPPLFLFQVWSDFSSLEQNKTPLPDFSDWSLFLERVPISSYFSPLLSCCASNSYPSIFSWFAGAWLQSHCSTVTVLDKVSGELPLAKLPAPS